MALLPLSRVAVMVRVIRCRSGSPLKAVTRRRILKCPDEYFAAEMGDFVWNETKGKFMATSGRHDDRIMTMAGLVQVSQIDVRQQEIQEETKTVRREEEEGARIHATFSPTWRIDHWLNRLKPKKERVNSSNGSGWS